MKPTDLMLEDWVLWKNRYVQIVRTCSVVYSFGHRDVWLAHCNDDNVVECHDMSKISPIPLTPEILKKNGFYDRNTQWYYKRFRSYVCFDIAISLVYKEIEVSKVCGAGTDCEEEEYGSSIVFGNDICVHTLQHALRLCGLNELADNFKI